jgi:hypothetical protein
VETPAAHAEETDFGPAADAPEELSALEVTRDGSPDDGRVGWDRWDSLLAVGIVVATCFVHPVHLVLSRPYWLDEAWVAVITRVPLSQLRHYSASAPVGFVVLLRLVPGSGLQRGRLLVLAFSAATAVMAYVMVRGCRWRSKPFARFVALAAALVVMLAPLSLIRNDLKQYTSDGFCALVVFTVAMWVDRPPERSPWWVLVAAVAVLPFSSTSLFVSAAVFAGLLGAALSRRNRRRVVDVLGAGAATGVAFAAFFVVLIAPNTNGPLRNYWNAYYLTGSPFHILHVWWMRLTVLRGGIGMPALAFAALFLTGLVVLWGLQARVVAIAAPALWIEMLVAGRLRRYPFLDLRTSHFLFVSSLVVCAIGAGGLVYVVYRWNRWIAGAIGVALLANFTLGVRSHIGELHIPLEDARSQTQYVAEHRVANDVILVNSGAAFAFSYYWPHGAITTHANALEATGFVPRVAGLDAVYALTRRDDDVVAALREATDRWRRAGAGSRLFIIRSHVNHTESSEWRAAFTALGLHPRMIRTGHEPLLEVDSP